MEMRSWNVCLSGTAVKTFLTSLFYFILFPDEMPSFAASGGRTLRQTAPGDLTLTCRTLTSYGACSPVRTLWGQRVKAGQSPPGGFIWVRSQAELLPERQRQDLIRQTPSPPKPGTHLGLSSPAMPTRLPL